MTEPSFSSMPNACCSGLQSTRNRVPVTSTDTGPASKRHLPGPCRCAIATSAAPFSTRTRAPFDSRASTRIRPPRSRTIELPSEKRIAVGTTALASIRSPAVPATAAGPASESTWNEIGRRHQKATAAATALTPNMPTEIRRAAPNHDRRMPDDGARLRVVTYSTKR